MPQDCRLTVFADIKEATDLWIKGDKFTVENVFGPCEALAAKYAYIAL